MIFEYYRQKIELLKMHGTEDEWYFSKVCSQALEGKTPEEAFESILDTVDYAIAEEDTGMLYYHVEFLLHLQRHSDTTELKSGMVEKLRLILEKSKKSDDDRRVRELIACYRIEDLKP